MSNSPLPFPPMPGMQADPPPPPPPVPDGVRFVAFTNEGRVDGWGNIPLDSFHFCRNERGHNIVIGDGRPETHYIEFVGEVRAPVLRVRPPLEQSFDKSEIAVGEPATMTNLPPATVTFEGPVKGSHKHEGGDLVVGWSVPGTYTVCVEAFPCLPLSCTLTVGATP